MIEVCDPFIVVIEFAKVNVNSLGVVLPIFQYTFGSYQIKIVAAIEKEHLHTTVHRQQVVQIYGIFVIRQIAREQFQEEGMPFNAVMYVFGALFDLLGKLVGPVSSENIDEV